MPLITIRVKPEQLARYKQLKGKRTWKQALESGLGMQQKIVTVELVDAMISDALEEFKQQLRSH